MHDAVLKMQNIWGRNIFEGFAYYVGEITLISIPFVATHSLLRRKKDKTAPYFKVGKSVGCVTTEMSATPDLLDAYSNQLNIKGCCICYYKSDLGLRVAYLQLFKSILFLLFIIFQQSTLLCSGYFQRRCRAQLF